MSKFFVFVMIFTSWIACKQVQDNSPEIVIANSPSQEPLDEPALDPLPEIKKVSAFNLEDQEFSVTQVSIGLQSYVRSESPYIRFKLSEEADYVEIIRCKSDTLLTTGVNSTNLVDLEFSSYTEQQKASIYRSNDYFKAAEDNLHCELITDGHARTSFFDSFAPSGNFRYLIRACVSPSRLTDTEKLSGRNCSRRVAISSELHSYVNNRKAKEAQAFKLTAVYSSKIDTITHSMKALAAGANAAIDQCEEQNKGRLVDQKIRNAWINIGSAVIEVGFEFVTVGQTLNGKTFTKYYSEGLLKPFNHKTALLDLTQLIGAAEGYILANTFKQIASSSHDIIRSCARYKRLIDEYIILETSLADYGFKYGYYFELANLAQANQLIVDGEEVYIPEVQDVRVFKD